MLSEQRFWDETPYTERFFVLLSFRCNATCSHCITSSSPRIKELMGTDVAKRIIKECSDLGYTYCVLSGGEALLYYDTVRELLAYGSSLGLTMNIETNCFWATNPKTAEDKLHELMKCGLSSALFSTDVYHQSFISVNKVINAVAAAKKLKLFHIVSIVKSNTEEHSLLIQKLKDHDIEFVVNDVNPFGAGSAFSPEMLSHFTTDTLDDCGELGMTFMPNGDTIACCNPGIHPKWSPIYLGNHQQESIALFHKKMVNDEIISAIATRGILYLSSIVTENNQRTYSSICQLCKEILSDPVLTKKLYNSLLEPSRQS